MFVKKNAKNDNCSGVDYKLFKKKKRRDNWSGLKQIRERPEEQNKRNQSLLLGDVKRKDLETLEA